MSWDFYQYASLFSDAFYNQGKEPQPDGSNDYDQYGFDLGARYQLTDKLPVSVTYRHTIQTPISLAATTR